MATAQGEDYTNLCSLQELFHGRFSEAEIALFLEKNNGDIRATADYIISADPTELRAEVERENNSWNTVERKIREVRSDRPLLAVARAGMITTVARLFSCADCDTFWWRRTPQRKEVSKCDRCRRKYDPVPRDREWGWAEFNCQNCGHIFGGWCAMYMTSPCFNCGIPVGPLRILPPNKSRNNRTRNQHSCNAWDCAGNPHGVKPPPGSPEYNNRCVHPQSRRANGLPIVVQPSELHDSTGSTVNTFLPQDDLKGAYEEFFSPPLAPIPEEPPAGN